MGRLVCHNVCFLFMGGRARHPIRLLGSGLFPFYLPSQIGSLSRKDWMAEFDSVAKSLISTYPEGFLAFLLGQPGGTVLEMLNTEQPTVETQIMDSLLRVQVGGREVLVHCELQTTDSTDLPMPRRMAGYMGRCIADHGLPLFSHVLYLRPDAGRGDPGHYIQEDAGYEVVIRYKVIRLSQLDGATYLSSGNPGVLPFTPLMERPAGLDADAWLGRCVEATEGLSVSRSAKDAVLGHMGVLSSLVCDDAIIYSLISEEIMNRFPLLESFRQRGVEQGIEQGIEQGGREFLLDVLALRFPPDQVRPLADRIAAIDDVQRLKQLHRAAIQMPSLEAFSNLLDDPA